MDDLIIWLCLPLNAPGCYLLSPVEKVVYLAGLLFGLLAGAPLLYGALIRIFTR